MDERIQAFLEANQSAAMITLRADGTPHVARIGLGIIEGKIWSSATQGRVRTKHIRRDPRSTLYISEPGYRWLGLETTVTILEGPTSRSSPCASCARCRRASNRSRLPDG